MGLERKPKIFQDLWRCRHGLSRGGSSLIGGNAFLPGAYAGSYVNIQNMKPDAVIRDLKNSNLSREEQRKQADLLDEDQQAAP